jgi:hypothetical protein
MKVRFKGNPSRYRDLTPGNLYRVIGIEADHFRLMNDLGQPYLYSPGIFEVVDNRRPRDWRAWQGEQGEQYAYPPALARPGFFEDYFDHDKKAMATLQAYLAACCQPRRRAASA